MPQCIISSVIRIGFVLWLSMNLSSCQLLFKYIVAPLVIKAIIVSSDIGRIIRETTVGYLTEKGLDWLLGVDDTPESPIASGEANIKVQPDRKNSNKGTALQSVIITVQGSRPDGSGQVRSSQIPIKRSLLIYERIGPGYEWHPMVETKRLLRERMIIGSAQISLLDLDYNPGSVDGVYGYRTAAALKNFQRDYRLNATGTINPETVNALLGADFLQSLN